MNFQLKDLIYHVPSFLSKKDCIKLISFYDKNSDKSGNEISFDSDARVDKPSLFKSIDLEENTEEYGIIFSATEKVINLYCKYLNDQKLFFHTFKHHYVYSHRQRLLKYEEGSYLHNHTDLSLLTQASITFNLNDDYMGGDFSFFNGNYKIKLGCGDALIFPAGLHWVHGVEKITSGNRYSTNSFLQPAPAWVEERAVNYLNEMVSKTDMQKNRYKIEE